MLTFIEVKDLGTQMPNQIEARTTAGHYVYFRGRWNHLDMSISLYEDKIHDNESNIFCQDGSENDAYGWLTADQFYEVFKKTITEQNIGKIAD